MRERDCQHLIDFIRRRVLKDNRVRLDPDTPLFGQRLLDSMNILALIGYVERRRGRRLTDEELVMERFRTVRSIVTSLLNE